MSHIAFDLDALPLVPKVARSAGIQEAVVGWGLTQMWEWCWREKTDRVTTNHLRGFFGSELGGVLVDFGFLEAIGSGLWRVRGAARYLRIRQAQSDAGKRSKGNLKQYREPEASDRVTRPESREGAGGEPEVSRTDGTGSTATSDERRANDVVKPPKRERKPSAAEDFFGWLNATRASAKGLEPQPPPSASRINKTFGDALTTCGRADLEGRYRAYLADGANATKEPPWPWEVFGASWSWRKAQATTPQRIRTLNPGEDPYADQHA